MFAPRWLIAAGIGLIAMALGPAGHGLWWLVGLVFAFGHCGRRLHACAPGARRGDSATRGQSDPSVAEPTAPAAPQPDPSHDRHEAFPRA